MRRRTPDDVIELTLGVGKGPSGATPPVTGSTFSPRTWNGTVEYVVIPEPVTLALLGFGGLALARRHRSGRRLVR